MFGRIFRGRAKTKRLFEGIIGHPPNPRPGETAKWKELIGIRELFNVVGRISWPSAKSAAGRNTTFAMFVKSISRIGRKFRNLQRVWGGRYFLCAEPRAIASNYFQHWAHLGFASQGRRVCQLFNCLYQVLQPDPCSQAGTPGGGPGRM